MTTHGCNSTKIKRYRDVVEVMMADIEVDFFIITFNWLLRIFLFFQTNLRCGFLTGIMISADSP